MRIVRKRNRKSLVDCSGYVDLPSACIRANKTGFFGLSQRVAPDSFDGNNTNIDPRECFFGGRRVELALQLKDKGHLAAKSADSGTVNSSDVGNESSSGQSE